MTTRRKRGRPPHRDVLTPAEWRVAEAVRHGLTNRAIATGQGISLDAVKFHVGNALAKLGFDRRSQLRRWAGVRTDSHLAHTETPMNDDMQLGAIGQIARTVSDIARARSWYADILGLPHLYSFGNLAFFDCGGKRLMLSEGMPAAESILYFTVPGIRAAHATLEVRGVRFVAAPHLIHRHPDGTEEWMAFFHDLDARPLALMSKVAPIAGIPSTGDA